MLSQAPLGLQSNILIAPCRRFFFLRHGETDWNLEGRIQGQTDVPLNATGVAQARAAALCMARHRVDRIVTSPLRRAFDTAQAVAETLGASLHVDEELKERSFGGFEGRIISEIKTGHGILLDQSLRRIMPPDGETWDETLTRSVGVVGRWLADHPDEALLFVSHAGPFSALHRHLLGRRQDARNATPYLFAPSDGTWRVEELGAA